ncbi:MAG TPA: sigma-54 dependent transcriptional regulator [Methylobacter sp.]|jgi:transcriptional regulator with PAS, ATPase and Fis domain
MNLSKTIIGKDPALKSLLRSVKTVAPTDATVLITGETGTGKELIAAAILKNSRRSEKEFIALNCAALPESLIESELFGYCKGAFTGAIADKKGILATVDGGTLFLDEINSLPLSVQVKLLRFIEAGEYLPVGFVKTCKADVRIIAASNANLHKQVSAGQFREDLYFRLNVVPLLLSPLRERLHDIKLLMDHFLSYFAKKYATRTLSISIEVLEVLQRYPWPGNIRELRNLCESLTVLRRRRIIELNDLPREYLEVNNRTGLASLFELPKVGVDWPELEVSLIRQAMAKTNGKYQEASLLLGMSRDALYYRTKKHGLTLDKHKNL